MNAPGQQDAISVIIPLFNKRTTVARAVKSALNQDGVSVEVIVVDDGSVDGSDAVVEGLGDGVRLVRQQNAGPSAARNHGARLATKPLLLFLDADDELLPGCLAAHARTRKVAPDVQLSICSFRVMVEDTLEREERVDQRPADVKPFGDICLLSRFDSSVVTNVSAAAICVNKNLFVNAGGFDEQLRCWEITEFLYRVALKAATVALISGVHVAVHVNESNSQFARTSRNIEHKACFAHRLLDIVDQVPREQRAPLLRSVRDSMYSALHEGELLTLRRLAQRSWRYRSEYSGITKLCVAATLPSTLLRILLFLRNAF